MRRASSLSLSLIHGTIHHHQQSSFLTNMTVKQSFLTKLDIFQVQSFFFDVIIGKRLQ